MSRDPLSVDDVRALIDANLSHTGLTLGEGDADAAGPTLQGRGGQGVELNLVGLLEAAEDAEPASWVASYLQGVEAVIGGAAVPEGSFAELAGGIVPRLDGPGFVDGVAAAGGATPFCRPWAGELVLTYWMRLEWGAMALIDTSVVARWGVTDDRVLAAARSLLFHNSRNHDAESLDGGLERLVYADGLGSSRVVVIEDLLWDRASKGLLVGVPEIGQLIYGEAAGDEGRLDALRAEVERAFGVASYPLSRQIFRVHRGRVTVVDGAGDDDARG